MIHPPPLSSTSTDSRPLSPRLATPRKGRAPLPRLPEILRGFTNILLLIVIVVISTSASSSLATPPTTSPSTTPPAPLTAAGDSENLWLVKANLDAKTIAIYHHHQSDPPNTLFSVRTLSGRLAPNALTAADSVLWTLYDNLSLQSIHLLPNTPRLLAYEIKIQPPIPATAARFRAIAANRLGPWVLLNIDQQQILDPIAAEEQKFTSPQTRPPGPSALPENNTATQPPSNPTATLPTDCLLRLDRDHWTRVPLPDDWSPDRQAWLVMPSPQSQFPWLITVVHQPTGDALRLYRSSIQQLPSTNPAGDSPPINPLWVASDCPLPEPINSPPIVLQNQILLPNLAGPKDQSPISTLAVSLRLYRPQTLTSIGSLELPSISPTDPWAIAPVGQTAALIAWPPSAKPLWTRINLQGQTVTPAAELTEQSAIAWLPWLDYTMLIAVLGAVTLVLILYWRRDPATNQLQLPSDVVPADLWSRLFAGLIDLLPCVGVAMILFSVNLADLPSRWPGRGDSLQAILPGATAIALYLLYATLTETIAGRTVGKILLGLRVTNLKGATPNAWQLLGRNITKIFDLLPPFALLILPLVLPSKQRLGDLVARTVVVAPKPPLQPHDPLDEDI